jgi:hypothetical protein
MVSHPAIPAPARRQRLVQPCPGRAVWNGESSPWWGRPEFRTVMTNPSGNQLKGSNHEW